MIRTHLIRRALRAAPVAAILLAACQDAPTVPLALERMAGGREWVAVEAPRDLPSSGTWSAYLDRSTRAGAIAAEEVETLRAEARAAMIGGDAARAEAIEGEAVRVALQSLRRTPDASAVRAAVVSLERWMDRARDTDAARRTEIGAAIAVVRSAHGAADRLLTAGDTLGALLRVADAAAEIRGHAPDAVALRVLARAESELETIAVDSLTHRRAVHLLRAAREAIVDGDPMRSLQRALYALQLAHGRGLAVDTIRLPKSCPPAACAP